MNGSSQNMPILWQNALMQFSTEIGKKAWIWYAENHGSGMQYAADRYAVEVEELVLKLKPMMIAAGKNHDASDEVIDDLLKFILIRHANQKIGGNTRPTYLGDHQ